MREMKDSGFDWLKEIPKDWKLIRIKNLIANVYNVKKKFKEVDVLSLGVNGVVIKENLNFGMNPTNYDDHNIVKKGQYVICLRDLDGPLLCGISKYEGCLSALYYIFDFNKHVNKYFFNYIMKTTDYTRFIDAFSYGMRHSYNFLQFGNLKIPFPDLIEQKLIVDFLDIKCAEIDGITKDLQEQIETLENYKKSVITEAVTKGLNPNVEMKSSPITWAKNIPSHWEYMPNKYIMTKIKKICPVHNDEDIISLSMNGVVVRDLDAGGKMPTTFNGYQFVYPGNLLMCLFDYDVTPRCIGYINNYGITSPAYSQFKMKRKNYAKYYYYYYIMIDNTKELLHLAKNLRHSFTEDELGKIYAIVPPVQEQKEIADYLDIKCAEIDEIIKNKKEQIEIIEEYKKSLIYEYVTGKKEVKNA